MGGAVALFLTAEQRARWRGRFAPIVVDLRPYGAAVRSWAAGQAWDQLDEGATDTCEDITATLYAHILADMETQAHGERDPLEGLPDLGDDPLQGGDELDNLLAAIDRERTRP
jgi:hypothetical protein